MTASHRRDSGISTPSEGADTLSPATIDVLVERHRSFLRFLERRVGGRAAAEEILQAAFVKAVERGDEVRDGESVTAWFYRVLRNAVADFYRRRDAERRALQRHAAEAAVATELDADLEAAVCECVHGLIPTLKAEYADILKSVEVAGRSVADEARRLGITPGNAAVRVHPARQALRQRLEAASRTCTDHGCLDCVCRTGREG